jgi:hypothetical protein
MATSHSAEGIASGDGFVGGGEGIGGNTFAAGDAFAGGGGGTFLVGKRVLIRPRNQPLILDFRGLFLWPCINKHTNPGSAEIDIAITTWKHLPLPLSDVSCAI